MDVAIHWGMVRHLKDAVEVKVWVPSSAIVLDLLVLVPFVAMKFRSDLLTIGITTAVAAVIFVLQWWAVGHRATADARPSARR